MQQVDAHPIGLNDAQTLFSVHEYPVAIDSNPAALAVMSSTTTYPPTQPIASATDRFAQLLAITTPSSCSQPISCPGGTCTCPPEATAELIGQTNHSGALNSPAGFVRSVAAAGSCCPTWLQMVP